MPEGPEVRQSCQRLDMFAGTAEETKVSNVMNFSKDGSSPIWPELIGQRFHGTRRKGKVWVLDFDTHSLIGHFAMWGHFVLDSRKPAKHIRKQIDFENGMAIRYCDMRNWGKMELVPKDEAMNHRMIAKLGIDVSQEFDFEEAFNELRKHDKAVLADILMGQTVLAGLGNIWRAEAIGREGLDALRTIGSLTDDELRSLIDRIDHIMNRGGNRWVEIYKQKKHLGHNRQIICTHRKGRRLWHLDYTSEQ